MVVYLLLSIILFFTSFQATVCHAEKTTVSKGQKYTVIKRKRRRKMRKSASVSTPKESTPGPSLGDVTSVKKVEKKPKPKLKKRRKTRAEKRSEKEEHLPNILSVDKNKLEGSKAKKKTKSKDKRGASDIVGSDIKEFGETVAFGIDRIIKKKSFDLFGDPWTIQGIPLIFHSPHTAFHLGIHFMLNNIRRQDPHKVSITGQILASSGGRYRHFLNLDFPYAFNNRFSIKTQISYNRDVTNRYFGIGNDTQVDNNLVDQNSILFRNERTYPVFSLEILRRIGKRFRAGPIFGLKWMKITAPDGSLLASQRPLGTDGGRTHYLGAAIIYDTLDFAPYPTKGTWHELYFYTYPKFLGSNYEFFRTTYTFRKYWRLHRTLTLAHRSLFEFLTGDVPFYELNVVGGSDSTLGFGADRFIRGFHSNQFMDRIRLISGVELRWDPLNFKFAKQRLTLGFVPFFDIGRVWDKLFPLQMGHFHASAGWGMRLTWNHRFIVRADYAVNAQGTGIYFELGHSF